MDIVIFFYVHYQPLAAENVLALFFKLPYPFQKGFVFKLQLAFISL